MSIEKNSGCDPPHEANLYDRVGTLGRELCRCIGEKRRFPEQEPFLGAFRARMSGLVEFMGEYWGFERDYWRDRKG